MKYILNITFLCKLLFPLSCTWKSCGKKKRHLQDDYLPPLLAQEMTGPMANCDMQVLDSEY